MTKPLDRFALLETARPDRDDEPGAAHDAGRSERFIAIANTSATEPAARDPFAPPPEPGPYKLEARDGRLTLRCAECGQENARSAHDACAGCNAPLDSRATRHLNVQLEQDERASKLAARHAADADHAHAARAAHVAQPAYGAPTPSVGAAAAPEPPFARSAWPAFDRVVERCVRGPAAAWPIRTRRMIAVLVIAGALALVYRATGAPEVGFLVAVVITTGVFLVLG